MSMTIREALGALFWCFIIFVGGLGLFGEGSSIEQENRLRSQMTHWPKVNAEIKSGNIRYKKNYGTITASYSYNYKGVTYTSNNVGLYDRGDAVKLFREKLQFASRIDCYVNPSNPSEAYLFNCLTEDSSPMGYRLGGLALMALGVVIFYFTFLHGFFQKNSKEIQEKNSTSERPNSYSLPRNSTYASKKVKKNHSIDGLVKVVNKYLRGINTQKYFNAEKYKLEAIVWIFCVSDVIIRDAYSEVEKKQNKFITNRIHADYIKLRSISIACIAIIQQLGASNLNLHELSKLYWDKFSMYSKLKRENHFIALLSSLLNEDETVGKRLSNKITVSAINKHSLTLCNSLASDILKWMLNFFRTKGFNEVYEYSVSLFENHAQWLTGLKDRNDGKVYVCCNRCSVFYEISELNDLACPDCHAILRKYWEDQAKQDYEISFKINRFCKHCGCEYREGDAGIHRYGLCYSCFGQFRKNFECLQNKYAITNK